MRRGGGLGEGGQTRPASLGRSPPRGKTDPPNCLTDEQRAALASWAQGKPPDDPISRLKSRDLLRLEETCLDWFRAHGRRHKDWLATVRTWIRKEFADRAGAAASGSGTADRSGRLPEIQRKPPPPKLTEAELEAAREAHQRQLAKTPWGQNHLRRQAARNKAPPQETPEQVKQAIADSLATAAAARGT